MKFFYMEKDFYAGQFTKRVIPKSFRLNRRLALFFTSLLNRFAPVFQSVLVRNFESTFCEQTVTLPTKNSKIDFDFIYEFVAELEATRLAELEAYLEATGLRDYTLTPPEIEALAKFDSLDWKFNKVIDVFSVRNTRNILSRNVTPNSGLTPYLGAGADNNSVITHISYDYSMLEKGNCIFIGGKTFVVTYQSDAFFSNDSHNLTLYLRNTSPTRHNQLFLATCLYQSLAYQYSWGNSISKSKIKTDYVLVPIAPDGHIDFKFMNVFVSAIQKLVIKDVVEYADRRIATTKKIITA